MIKTVLLSLAFLGLLYSPLMAQEVSKPVPEEDMALKTELVDKMHQIRPAKAQVMEAVDQVSRNLPPLERDKFLKMVERGLDVDKLDKLSRQTMMELFTVAELQKMVDYFGSPEAKAIGEKLPKYQEKLQPELFKMMDAAMMEQRTGDKAAPVLTEEAPKAEDTKTESKE